MLTIDLDDSVGMEYSELPDRLSELPDSLIFHIFWFLPMRDVVKTTFLSHRWNKLWTASPYLRFEDCKKVISTESVRNFINRALMFWRGMSLQKFKIDFGTPLLYFRRPLYNEIDLWLHFAKEHEVQELHVDMEYHILPNVGVATIEMIRDRMYWAPRCLYSCSSLKKLYIKGCNLHNPTSNVNWNQLKHLSIHGYEVSQDLVNRVLRGSPKLEVLVLSLMENHDDLTIRSISLKHLIIEKYLYYVGDDPSLNTELRICTPNLRILEIGGVPYSKCLMKAPTIQHVEAVILSDWCIEALGAMHSSFLNAKYLEIKVCSQEYEQIVDILEKFPRLSHLVLDLTLRDEESESSCLNFERNPPEFFLLQLRTVDVTWTMGAKSVFALIQILLRYASKLEKMVLREKRVESHKSWKSLVITAQKLLRMRRSSPTAELTFVHI